MKPENDRVEPSGALKGGKCGFTFCGGAIFFDGIHFLISGTVFRGKIVGLIGERPFQGNGAVRENSSRTIFFIFPCSCFRQCEAAGATIAP